MRRIREGSGNFGGLTRADSYLEVVNFPWTRGSPQIPWPRILCGFLLHELSGSGSFKASSAGAVIGKGGAMLKGIREQCGCLSPEPRSDQHGVEQGTDTCLRTAVRDRFVNCSFRSSGLTSDSHAPHGAPKGQETMCICPFFWATYRGAPVIALASRPSRLGRPSRPSRPSSLRPLGAKGGAHLDIQRDEILGVRALRSAKAFCAPRDEGMYEGYYSQGDRHGGNSNGGDKTWWELEEVPNLARNPQEVPGYSVRSPRATTNPESDLSPKHARDCYAGALVYRSVVYLHMAACQMRLSRLPVFWCVHPPAGVPSIPLLPQPCAASHTPRAVPFPRTHGAHPRRIGRALARPVACLPVRLSARPLVRPGPPHHRDGADGQRRGGRAVRGPGRSRISQGSQGYVVDSILRIRDPLLESSFACSLGVLPSLESKGV